MGCDDLKNKKLDPDEELVKKIKNESAKKIRAQEESDEILFGLGMFGIIGWSVSIPTLLGVALGIYLDNRFSPSFSWTLTLLFLGVVVGCLNAWYWIKEKINNSR